jgi:hypothetical protein
VCVLMVRVYLLGCGERGEGGGSLLNKQKGSSGKVLYEHKNLSCPRDIGRTNRQTKYPNTRIWAEYNNTWI